MTKAEHERLCLEHRHALQARVADMREQDPNSDLTAWLEGLQEMIDGRRPWGPPLRRGATRCR